MVLRGTMYITDNLDLLYSIPKNQMVKIVSLDEDGILDRTNNPDVLVGTCLLPPIEAMIAEADGNEQLYDIAYNSHLLEPYQQSFISALLAYLYKGGSLFLFLPELGMNTRDKLIFHLYDRYGIHPGVIDSKGVQLHQWFADEKCTPLWLSMIYSVGAMTAYEFLQVYPADADIMANGFVVRKLIAELKPYEDTYEEKLSSIRQLHQLTHKKGQLVINPLEEVITC